MRKKELEQRLHDYEQSSYFDLAEQLKTGVDERLAGVGNDPDAIAAALDAEYDQTADTLFRQELVRRLGKLPHAAALEMLRTRLGDTEADDLLRQRAQVAK